MTPPIFSDDIVAVPASSAADVDRALKAARTVELGRAWSDAGDGFAATRVRTAWTPDGLWVRAEMDDEDPFTRADADSRRLWELGDVFEMFFQAEGAAYYAEMHVAPGNHRLHIRIPVPDFPALKQGKNDPADFIVDPPEFESATSLSPGGWTVNARIPGRAVSDRETLRAGDRWLASFCRYDAWSDARPPVLSSSSPHAEPNFHRRQEWRTLCF